MQFAKRLKEARIAKKIKRAELAEMVSKSARAVKAWELGQNKPGLETRRRIERVLKLPFGYLDNDYDPALCDVLSEFNLVVQNIGPDKKQHVVKMLESAIRLLMQAESEEV